MLRDFGKRGIPKYITRPLPGMSGHKSHVCNSHARVLCPGERGESLSPMLGLVQESI